MIFLRVMSFVEDEQIDLFDGDERVGKALIEDLGCANDHHVLSKLRHPHFL